jgi:hypothetical protein
MAKEYSKSNLKKAYNKRELAVIALCKYYSKLIIQDFQREQEGNKYWENRSNFAKDLMFTTVFKELANGVVGIRMAHGVNYGVYLELANNEEHAAIKPTINKFLADFKRDLGKIYG